MKNLLLALALIVPAALPAAPSHPVSTPQEGEEDRSGIAREDRQAQFRKEYAQATAVKAYDEMAKLIKRYVDEAVYEVIDICIAIESEETPELVDEIYALDRGWRKAFNDSAFVMNVYEFFSLQTSQLKRERQRLQKLYNRANNELLATLESGDGPKLEQLAAEFQG